MKPLCVECNERKKPAVPFRKLLNKTIEYVCLDCWDLLGYEPYFPETNEIVKRVRP